MQLADQAFMEELRRPGRSSSRAFSRSKDGKPKVFRNTADQRLGGLLGRFRRFDVRSKQRLDDLVGEASGPSAGSIPRRCEPYGICTEDGGL